MSQRNLKYLQRCVKSQKLNKRNNANVRKLHLRGKNKTSYITNATRKAKNIFKVDENLQKVQKHNREMRENCFCKRKTKKYITNDTIKSEIFSKSTKIHKVHKNHHRHV